MYIKKILLFFALLIMSPFLSAQLTGVAEVDFRQFQLDFNFVESREGAEKPVYDGTPYLFGEFAPAEIYLIGGRGYKGIPMNYNIYNDDFEFIMDDIIYSLGNNDILSYIRLEERDFYYRTYTYNSAVIRGYLELVANGEYRFYKKHRVIYTEPQETSGYVEAKAASFDSRSPDYFIEIKDKGILYFNHLKDITEFFPDRKDDIEDYIKSKRLKKRREEDIIQLAKYLNK